MLLLKIWLNTFKNNILIFYLPNTFMLFISTVCADLNSVSVVCICQFHPQIKIKLPYMCISRSVYYTSTLLFSGYVSIHHFSDPPLKNPENIQIFSAYIRKHTLASFFFNFLFILCYRNKYLNKIPQNT